ncbi:uncharacterized protein LOC133188772 [Saccostrea echinata]|uniref:uncharacterized protein LOC133188772 n=1 Tax=Saccostrea echinata TaxID=191078 RepID=UPI002A801AD8|nr:uncharacterized protein LOC133188772 [Saccostrea echinata]
MLCIVQATSWISVTNDQFIGEFGLPYTSVTIRIRKYNTSTQAEDYVDYEKTYNVTALKSKEGDSINISWTDEYFQESGNYFILHEYNGSVSQIINITNANPSLTEKYVYHPPPFNSTNILIEVKNVTAGDAGFYIGSPSANNAWSGETGAVLIVSGKPLKPTITGDLDVKVGEYANLKCESRSTSAPYYYKTFPPLSYSWFVNSTKLDREDRETYSLIVTKDVRYNRYSCQSNETLESDESEEIRINLFCK